MRYLTALYYIELTNLADLEVHCPYFAQRKVATAVNLRDDREAFANGRGTSGKSPDAGCYSAFSPPPHPPPPAEYTRTKYYKETGYIKDLRDLRRLALLSHWFSHISTSQCRTLFRAPRASEVRRGRADGRERSNVIG